MEYPIQQQIKGLYFEPYVELINSLARRISKCEQNIAYLYFLSIVLFLFALCLALVPSAHGQELQPNAKPHVHHFYSSKSFWIREALIGAAVFADMHSTSQMLHHGNIETNIILGARPSDGKIAAFGVGAFAYWTSANILDDHFFYDDPNKYWKFAGINAMPIAAIITHIPPAVHNYELPAAMREGLICSEHFMCGLPHRETR